MPVLITPTPVRIRPYPSLHYPLRCPAPREAALTRFAQRQPLPKAPNSDTCLAYKIAILFLVIRNPPSPFGFALAIEGLGQLGGLDSHILSRALGAILSGLVASDRL